MSGWAPRIEVVTAGPQPRLDVRVVEPCVHHVVIELGLTEPAVPRPLSLSFRHPLREIHAMWRADYGASIFDTTLDPPWAPFTTEAARGAPVVCAYAHSGQNRLTFAWSDACNPVVASATVDEQTGELVCRVTLFELPTAPLSNYELTVRVDTRPVPYYEALAAVERWWSAMPEYAPAPVPDGAREPVYSTWYAFHLGLTADAVEEQCRLARRLGCGVVIIDDGWQTETVGRGYSSCGDWRPAASKFPDLRAHVARLQALGFRHLLWFAVPFVGAWSDAWSELDGKLLTYEPVGWEGTWGVVDPRFPEVRDRIVATYERAVAEWGLDGFKLDFIDELRLRPGDTFGCGRDTDSVVAALEQTLSRLPEGLLIEFRQPYTGPLMRRFANMLRASDCPNDALENRVRTLTLRLLAGSTAVHSDMLMWFPGDTVESAALQLLNVLFAVPQISMRLDEISAEHLEMLAFWLAFWRRNRDVLLDGRLRPLRPDANYPLVFAETDEKLIAAAYAAELVAIERLRPATYLVNATPHDRLVLELAEPAERVLRVRDCRGRLVDERRIGLDRGLTSVAVPCSGLVELDDGAETNSTRAQPAWPMSR